MGRATTLLGTASRQSIRRLQGGLALRFLLYVHRSTAIRQTEKERRALDTGPPFGVATSLRRRTVCLLVGHRDFGAKLWALLHCCPSRIIAAVSG